MTSTLYLLVGYNNYYNRIMKTESDISGYEDYIVHVLPNANFKPNDGVNTEHIFNIDLENDIEPDYLVVVENGEIVSRWFVIEGTRKLKGQYSYQLRRDLFADYWENIIDADTYIEKATLAEEDPLIVNDEGMSLNQIKTKETLLKDKTKRSWLVAYLARKDANGDATTFSGTVTPPGVSDLTSISKTEWEASNGVTTSIYTNAKNLKVNFGFSKGPQTNPTSCLNINLNQINENGNVNSQYSTIKLNTGYITAPNIIDNGFNWFVSQVGSTFNTIMSTVSETLDLTIEPTSRYSELLSLDGKTIKFDDDENIYRIRVNVNTITESLRTDQNNYRSNPTYFKMKELWTSPLNIPTGSGGDWGYFGKVDWLYVAMDVSEVSVSLISLGASGSYVYNIAATRQHLTDAPYDMICAPYETTELTAVGKANFTSNELAVNTVFSDLVSKYAGENASLYDVQRLPYCPISQLDVDDDKLDYTNWSEDSKVFYIKKDNTNVGVIFACSVSNFSGTILLDEPISITNAKMQSVCDKYRIVSPNYNGIFEFDPVKNNGLSIINYYCTYKPYNPYIQISPDFEFLYGNDFKDSRGMICGGDFSMPVMTSAWETYQRQNKNFQDIFARGIENLEVTQDAQRLQQHIAGTVGIIQGGLAGAMTGSAWSGGNLAALWAGAGAGAIASAAGMLGDVLLGEKLRNEAIAYRKDIHDLQLGNVKALPQSLSKTSAFVITNKIWPFLEYYTCTPEEKIAAAYSIAYEGMTVGKIGHIRDYLGNNFSYNGITDKGYIQGTVVRLNDITSEYHIAKEIASEIKKGVYTK